MARTPYQPAEGSVAARVVDYLRAEGDGASLTAAQIGQMFGIDQKNAFTALNTPIAHGLLVKVPLPAEGPAVIVLGNGTPLAELAGRLQRAKPYAPEAGTVPARVAAHFAERPDLYEMSSSQIAASFGLALNNVSGALARSVKAGLLAVRREGKQCWYRAGTGAPATPAATPATLAPAPVQPEPAAQAVYMPAAHGLTAALYNDGELYLHGTQPMGDGGVLLTAAQTAELRAYLLHTGQVSAVAVANGGSLT